MTPLYVACLLSYLAAPVAPAPKTEPAPKAEATAPAPKPTSEPAPKAEPATPDPKADAQRQADPPLKAPAKDEPATDAAVKKAVEAMQKFYENTKDFQADFQQAYRYKTFATTSKASGRVLFKKEGPAMRWDYLQPNEKVFVINGEEVLTYDKEARLATSSRLAADRLSASITFLWGQGKLEREFRISKSPGKYRKDLVELELVPKVPDARFQKIYFLLDPQNFSVHETVVIDPDGSENRMSFSKMKTNSGLSSDAFKLTYPKGTDFKKLN